MENKTEKRLFTASECMKEEKEQTEIDAGGNVNIEMAEAYANAADAAS